MNTLPITRKVAQDKELQARVVVSDTDYALVHTDEFGYEIVYQNGNPVGDIDENRSLRLWCKVALRLFAKLDQPEENLPRPRSERE